MLDYTNKVFANIAVFTNNKVKVLLSDLKSVTRLSRQDLSDMVLSYLKDLMGIEHVHIEGVLSMALNSHVGLLWIFPADIRPEMIISI